MGSRPIEKLYGENIQSDKDFKNDSARIYISQKSNIDEYFDIPKINVKLGNTSIPLEDSNNKSAVASKADVVRLIGRENIKLVTFHKGLNSQSKKTSDGGIDIIAGCNALNSDKTLSVQPMVKGNNLVQLLKEMIKMIEDVQSTVASFMEKQKKINDYILQDNNFIHICAMRGNSKLLEYIEDKNIDKYKSNGKGENILHLLLRFGWDQLALDLIDLDEEYLDYTNIIYLFYHYYLKNTL